MCSSASSGVYGVKIPQCGAHYFTHLCKYVKLAFIIQYTANYTLFQLDWCVIKAFLP